MDNKDLYNIRSVISYQIHRLGRQTQIPYEDLFQLGYLGYLRAQKNFKEQYGKMSLNYATQYIRDEILTAIKKERRHRSTHVGFGENNETENYEGADTTAAIDAAVVANIVDALEILEPLERRIIEASYLDSATKKLKEIGAKYDLSPQAVHQIKTKALKKLRHRLSN